MTLDEWARKWNIPAAALLDLVAQPATATEPVGESEAATQTRCRLDAGRAGWILWRNNVGALPGPSGYPVRFGLCNDSPAVSKRLKSSDLIGIRPVTITVDDVGRRIGQFAAIETKRAEWKRTPGDKRAQAQAAYHALVRQYGGHAGFSTGGLPL